MDNNIKKLTNCIDDRTEQLIKDNNFLINAFNVRLLKRLHKTFENFAIPFSNDKLNKIMDEYLIKGFKDINAEVSLSYKKVLYKYFDITNEYIHTHENAKEKIKFVTSDFVKKMYGRENPILNLSICNNFINEMMSKILIYDSNDLNVEITNIIKKDTLDIINELNSNNKEYLIEIMKEIIKFVFSKENV